MSGSPPTRRVYRRVGGPFRSLVGKSLASAKSPCASSMHNWTVPKPHASGKHDKTTLFTHRH